MAMTIEQQRALAAMRMRKRAADAQQIVSRGMLLPISKTAGGDHVFDSDAGILGAAKRAFSLPEEVYRGQVDPMSPQGIERGVEFAGMFTPAGAAARAGERAIPGVAKAMVREKVPVPSIQELKNAAKTGYDAVRDAGVDYRSSAIVDTSAAIQRALEADGILDTLAPKTFNILGRLQSAPEGGVAPIAGVEAARRAFGKAGQDFTNPTEQEAARRATVGLDNFIDAAARGPQPQTGSSTALRTGTERGAEGPVVRGDAQRAATLLKDARGNTAAAKRSGTVQGIEEAAELRAAASNSGQNLDNATRQRLVGLLLNPKKIAGFSQEERQALERVARGTLTGNTLRAVGNLLGGGGGGGMALTGAAGGAIGAAIGGPVGAAIGASALPTVGAGAKRIAADLTQRGLREADESIRMRSPEYRRALANAALVSKDPEERMAILRMLATTPIEGQGDRKR